MIPIWAKIAIAVFFVISVISAVRVFQECGVKALFLGNGAAYAAMSGMCD